MNRKNLAVLAKRKEAVATRVAAISREMQQALQPSKPAGDMLAGNALKVEIATLRAMDENRK